MGQHLHVSCLLKDPFLFFFLFKKTEGPDDQRDAWNIYMVYMYTSIGVEILVSYYSTLSKIKPIRHFDIVEG